MIRRRLAVLAAGTALALGDGKAAAVCSEPHDPGDVVAAIFDADVCPESDENGDGAITAADLTALMRAAYSPTPTATLRPTPTRPPAANLAPAIPALPVYRTFPGFEILRPIGATDPNEGQSLAYTPAALPEGGTLDARTGVFAWTPRADQLGPFYADFTVGDDGVPPLSTSGTLALSVAPLDTCTLAACEPATGCESMLRPLDSPCCAGAVPIRVAEPTIGCPEDLSVEIGRNLRGFGRLYNCDRFRLIAATQASVTVRLNVRGRCLPVGAPVTIAVRLEAHERPLIDRRVTTTLRAAEDGYAEKLLIFLPVTDATPDLEGQEADLSVEVIPAEGPSTRTAVRVVLTHDPLPDLTP